jgi:hypothetical protein
VSVITVGIKKEKKVRAVIVGRFVRYLLFLVRTRRWVVVFGSPSELF